MDNAARTRQRVLALFLPIAAVLYISAEALSPKGINQVTQTMPPRPRCWQLRRNTRLSSMSQARLHFSGSGLWPSRMR